MSRSATWALIATLVLLTAGACSAGPAQPVATPAAPSAASSSAAPPAPSSSAEQTCGVTAPAGLPVEDLSIPAADGVTLTAAAVGTGSRGVVLMHQTNDGLCGWLPYAFRLAGEDFAVLAFDRRCTFASSCVEGEAQYNALADVRAAVDTLRERGVADVALVGASLGGAVAIGTCQRVEVSRCAALSPAVFDLKLGSGLTATKAIGALRKPLLYAVAPDDSSSSLDEGKQLTGRAADDVVTFVELPAGAGHGWDTVREATDPAQPSAFAGQLEDFLRAG
jgi:dienelactone hydrolase